MNYTILEDTSFLNQSLDLGEQISFLQNWFESSGQTLSLAESCTGGGISAALVQRQGASNYFLGSIVSYSDLAKQNALGVTAEALKKHTAVSAEVAHQMSQCVRSKMNSTWALSVTGWASPCDDSKQKGEVFFSLSGPKIATVIQSVLEKNTRVENIHEAIAQGLCFLAHIVNQQK